MALAPRSASVAFMILSTRSSATSSDNDSGPTGMPAIFAVFSIIAGGTPSISISRPSAVKRSTQRLAKKPRESLTTIGVLPITRT